MIFAQSCETFFSVLRDGIPYCESDYHRQFGIRCESCNRYISGKVLEVGVFFFCCVYAFGNMCACLKTDGNGSGNVHVFLSLLVSVN